MSDRQLRQLEREASSGEPLAVVRWAAGLIQIGDRPRARALLHPLVKRVPDARPIFLSVLPEQGHAFCCLCGQAMDLNADGFPLSDKPGANGKLPKKRRVTKKKKYCYKCAEKRSAVERAIRGHRNRPAYLPTLPRPSPLKDCYCGRCGVLIENTSHRCATNLPDWLSGGKPKSFVERVERELGRPESHWSDWRSIK